MNNFLIIIFFSFFVSCNQKNEVNTISKESNKEENNQSIPKTVINNIVSTYDEKSDERLINHKNKLKSLSNNKTFSNVNKILINKIDKSHQDYFKSKSNYELLSTTSGNLFSNNNSDYAFIVYDKNYNRISIIIYNSLNKNYYELYRDIKVINGLENVDCNYGFYGTLDYQFADENLVNYNIFIEKSPKDFSEFLFIKITNITDDSNFSLNEGCLQNKFLKEKELNSLCIATSSVYNNWECLKFDKDLNVFNIFYGQVYAD